MAFNPSLLVKLQPSSLFTQPAAIPAIQPAKTAVQFWTYQAGTDTKANVQASGYFVYFADWTQTLEYNNGQYLQVGDFIYCACSDGYIQLVVNAIGSTITTLVYSTTLSYVNVPMTATQWNAMYDTPYLIVPAQGAHTLITAQQMIVEFAFNSAQFTAGGVVGLQYGTTDHGGGPLASATIAAATVNAWAANNIDGVAGAVPNAASADVINTGLYLSNATQAFATGDGSFNIKVYYSVANTTL